MLMPPVPIARLLVPETTTVLPDEFTRVESPIRGGLPHAIALAGSERLLLIAPSGLATTWRDAEPSTVVSTAAWQLADSSDAPLPLRLLFQSAGQSLAVAPLLAGMHQRLPDTNDLATRIELVLLDWTIHAGTIRGSGDFGSRVLLGWRPTDRAVDAFSDPPPNPVFVKRQPPDKRMASEVGRRKIDPRWVVAGVRSRIIRRPVR